MLPLQSITVYSRQLTTACGLSKVNIPGTNFTEPTDWSTMLMDPDLEFWMKDVKLLVTLVTEVPLYLEESRTSDSREFSKFRDFSENRSVLSPAALAAVS